MIRSTPTAELREMANQAARLAKQVRATHSRLRAAGDAPTRQAGYRLDDAAGAIQQAAGEIGDTIADLTRIANRGSCAAEWGLCPEHGNTLARSGRRTWCRAGRCRRRWDYDRGGLPCDQPATYRVRDTSGGKTLLCTGHADDARKRLIGASVTPLAPVGKR